MVLSSFITWSCTELVLFIHRTCLVTGSLCVRQTAVHKVTGSLSKVAERVEPTGV